MIKVNTQITNEQQFNASIVKVQSATGKAMKDLVKQSIILAAISAAKATPPGQGKDGYKSIPKKYKTRPIVKMPQPWKGLYRYQDEDGKMVFRSSPTSNKKLKTVKFALQAYRRKSGDWDYFPFFTKSDARASKLSTIPNAAAGKLGWIRGLSDLDKKSKDYGTIRNPRGLGSGKIVAPTKYTAVGEVINRVKYTGKIAPTAAMIGIQKGLARFRHTYAKHFDKALKNV